MFLVSSADRPSLPTSSNFGYKRPSAREVVEVDGAHVVMFIHPRELSALIAKVAAAIAEADAAA